MASVPLEIRAVAETIMLSSGCGGVNHAQDAPRLGFFKPWDCLRLVKESVILGGVMNREVRMREHDRFGRALDANLNERLRSIGVHEQ
jgi:hypothetical protein